MSYATISDVQDRLLRPMTETEQDACEVLLGDASVMIDATGTKADASAKKIVCCRMVIRILGSNVTDTPIGATQGSMSANGYAQSWTIANGSTGQLYLSKDDKKLLGLGNALGSHSPLEELCAE